MFFLLSKLFWLVVQPISLSFLLLVLGWLAAWQRWRKTALLVTGAGLLVLGLSAFTTLGFLLILPLEDRFPPAAPPAQVDTIVMLGGATMGRVSTARGIVEFNDAGDRLSETLRLANRYPQARIVLSGGVGLLMGQEEPEAITAQRFFLANGIAPDRLVLEGASRNTDENASETAALLGANTGTVLLVTSAFHMPRSVGLFRAQGITVVPWPVDYRSAGTEGIGFDLANPILNLNTTTIALREWIGLVAYKLTGRIAEWLPVP